METEENIKVFIRIRPNDDTENNLIKYRESNSINIPCKYETKSFSYDKVVDENTTQEEMFESCKSLFTSFISGYNSTLFAYGQTSSGKTHTMTGTEGSPGLIQQGLQYIFDKIRGDIQPGVEYLVKCSFVEIYNENLFDLLDQNCKRLYLKANLSQGYYVDQLSEKVIENTKQALQILKKGLDHRHVASTAMNHESSRSHSVFTIILECCESIDGVKNIRKSVLHLVDLAGSERQKNTNSEGTTLKEAGSINKSLHVLGQVISALVDESNGKKRYIRYSESKLTRLLKDSIGGNSKTLLVACVHPDIKYTSETLSTLQFASNVKKIKNKAIVNIEVSGSVESLQKEVNKLREQLRRRSFNLFISPDDGKIDVQWQKRFISAMAMRANLIAENCHLKEMMILIQSNKLEAEDIEINYKEENKALKSKLKTLELELTKARIMQSLSEQETVAALYKEYNELIGSDLQKEYEKSSNDVIEIARLREQLTEANVKINQLQKENAKKEFIQKNKQRKLESELASMRKILSENDKEKEEIAVKRRQTIMLNKENMGKFNSINYRPRNTLKKFYPNIEEMIKETEMSETSDEWNIDSITKDLEVAEFKNKEFARNIGLLEYEINVKKNEIIELKEIIENKVKVEIDYKELQEKFKATEMDLEKATESIRKYEIQMTDLNIEKTKSIKNLNEKISNLEFELGDALSERDSLKNELEVSKISFEVLNREFQEKSVLLFNKEEQHKREMENILYQLTGAFDHKKTDFENEISVLETKILEQDKEINIINSEKANIENLFVNQSELLENIIKEHQLETHELKKSLECSINEKKLLENIEIQSKSQLEQQKSSEKIILNLENKIIDFQKNLEIEKTTYQDLMAVINKLLTQTNTQSDLSVIEGIKNLEAYVITKNKEMKKLAKDYDKLASSASHSNSNQKIKILERYRKQLQSLKSENSNLSRTKARIRMIAENCDQPIKDMIIKAIGPD